MKANGRNYKMFRYCIHEYMDMRPEEGFATFPSQKAAEEAVRKNRSMISGSITSPVEVSPLEYFKARQSEYWDGYQFQLDRAAEDCTPEWLKEYESYVNAL